jgi:hypothetical protein
MAIQKTDQGDWWTSNAPKALTNAPGAGGGGSGGQGTPATAEDVQRIAQQVFGHPLDDPTPWVGQVDAFQNLSRSPEAQAYAQQPKPPAAGGGPGGAPTGGNLKDPAYVDSLIAYYGNQPGADPSLKNDPNYWKQKILSGELGPDQGYIVNKMQTAWQGGGGGGAGAGAGMGGFQSAPGWGSGTSAPNPYQAPAPYQAPTFTTPTPYQAPTFTAPTGLTEQNDPGYQARLRLGTEALQGSEAAKGSVLSGGALKALDQYAQDYASNEFGNVYNRALNTFGANANQQLGAYQTNLGANQWAQGQQATYGLAGWQANANASANAYGLNAGVQRGAQQDYWSRLNDLYQGGLSATRAGYQLPG